MTGAAAGPAGTPRRRQPPDKIRRTVEGKKVRLHVFDPSNRKLWTVLGSEREYWVDPDLRFCTCAGFYFSRLGGKPGGCYHLKSLDEAAARGMIETVRSGDAGYGDFVASLVSGD